MIERIAVADDRTQPQIRSNAWDCVLEGAPSSTLLLEESQRRSSRSILFPDGLQGFEGGVQRSYLSEDVCSRPSSGIVVVGVFALLVHLDESFGGRRKMLIDLPIMAC